ncbi:MAG: anhydro-N-acetylmuramic acid kinase [Planctomycetota bacterium]
MPPDSTQIRLVVGAMSGTSLDGLDVALSEMRGRGLQLRSTLLGHRHVPFDEHLARRLRIIAATPASEDPDVAAIARDLGDLHAEAIADLLGSHRTHLVCVHGQTIHHQPPVSRQIIDPAPIAARIGCPVVFDLRQADLAAGGQGAPITPLADWTLFRHPRRRRAIVNLGGFCNVTILPAGGEERPERSITQIRGFDVCACNQVLDGVARQALGAPFDEGGSAAGSGCAHPPVVDELHALLTAQRLAGRSLGTGDEAASWVTRHVAVLPGPDLAASAVESIARCIADAVMETPAEEIVVAGGGAENLALLRRLAAAVNLPVRRSDEAGVPVAAREALAMAVLGALCADGVPITLPQVTGCREPAPVAGTWAGRRLESHAQGISS